MRCPKCGYISFDRQRSCSKCSNDLTAVAEQLKGTVGKAAAPFFLGAIIGEQKTADAWPDPALREMEGQTLPADENEFDLAVAPHNESDLEDQPLSALGLEEIDVAELLLPQKEKEAPMPSLDEEEAALMGIEFPFLEPDEFQSLAGQEISPDDRNKAPNEEIVDLFSLMNFATTPAQTANTEENHDIFEPSFNDDEQAPADAPKKPVNAGADSSDPGLALETDDH